MCQCVHACMCVHEHLCISLRVIDWIGVQEWKVCVGMGCVNEMQSVLGSMYHMPLLACVLCITVIQQLYKSYSSG